MSIKLMTIAWDMPIPSGPKMVLLALCDNANDQGECYPSIGTIAKKCSMSERSIFSHIDWLEKGKALYRENRKGRSSIYHIHPCKFCTPEEIAPAPANIASAPANIAPAPANIAPRIITKPLLKSSHKQSTLSDATAPRKKEQSDGKEDTELQAACRATWKSYSNAYFNRYGVEPLRNAAVNSSIKQFVQKLPYSEAPHVATFYVNHNDKYYIQKTHPVALLPKDAEGLRTQWATGRTMTATKANQIDKTASNMDSVAQAIEMSRRKHATV